MIPRLPWPTRRQLLWATITLAIGTAGGIVFDSVGVPAAFLAGSMIAVALAALARVPVALPMPLREAAFVILGAILGTTVDRRTLDALPEWPVSLVGLLIGLVLLMTLVPLYLERLHGIDRRTARMCAIPGALGHVVVLALQLNVDARRVAILHTLRLATLLTLIPAVGALNDELRHVALAGARPALDWGPAILLIALSCAIVPLVKTLRFPAPTFIAPMLFVGGLSMTGVVDGLMPGELLYPSLIVSGSVVGARFAGTTLPYMWHSLKAGVGGILLGIVLMGLMAWPVSVFTGVPFVQLWLAYAPGGFDAMPVLAFSLGLDPAFVAGHQLIRFVAISAALPFLFRWPKDVDS
ncbi:MAG: AbrB family transcriptional regulator [Rhodospirillales bacterium]|nr:AbrB family transcriptional regulator [Rhodospirillales bacterium]